MDCVEDDDGANLKTTIQLNNGYALKTRIHPY